MTCGRDEHSGGNGRYRNYQQIIPTLVSVLPWNTLQNSSVNATYFGLRGHHQAISPKHAAFTHKFNKSLLFQGNTILQGDSVTRGPKLLSIKNCVIEIITWKFTYTYRERCKTGPAHNRCWNVSPFTSKHIWMRFSKFWNTFPKFVWGL